MVDYLIPNRVACLIFEFDGVIEYIALCNRP